MTFSISDTGHWARRAIVGLDNLYQFAAIADIIPDDIRRQMAIDVKTSINNTQLRNEKELALLHAALDYLTQDDPSPNEDEHVLSSSTGVASEDQP